MALVRATLDRVPTHEVLPVDQAEHIPAHGIKCRAAIIAVDAVPGRVAPAVGLDEHRPGSVRIFIVRQEAAGNNIAVVRGDIQGQALFDNVWVVGQVFLPVAGRRCRKLSEARNHIVRPSIENWNGRR